VCGTMEWVESGAVVGLSCVIGGEEWYLSVGDANKSTTSVGLRKWCQAWERFKVVKRVGNQQWGIIGVQNSWLTLQNKNKWLVKSGLPATGVKIDDGFTPFTVSIASVEGLFLAPDASELKQPDQYIGTIASEKVHFWKVTLQVPPVLKWGTLAYFSIEEFEKPALEVSGEIKLMAAKMLKATQDVGAFLLAEHAIDLGIMSLFKRNIGNLLWRDDADAEDWSFKQNSTLMEERNGVISGFQAKPVGVTHEALLKVVRDHFDACILLSRKILNLLAIGQEIHSGAPAEWRNIFQHERYLGLRCLAYHPGPLKKSDGSEVVTTARHTDATWLTLLIQDENAGLQVWNHAQHDFVDVHDVSSISQLVVNTGNVLELESGEFYRAVCHRVVRVSEEATRLSIPFFFDRNGGETKGC
jgi:hypothetical protein